jgi:hypothetical protein
MNDQAFNKELQSIAKDLELHFDAQVRKWGVYQMRSSHFVLSGPNRPWLLFYIEDADGNFRLPDRRDFIRVVNTVNSSRVGWEKGGDWVADQLEAKAKAREDKLELAQQDRFSQASKAVRKSLISTSTRIGS